MLGKMGLPDGYHFLTVGAIQALYKRILIGLTWLDILNRYTGLFGPSHEHLAQEFRAVVRPQDLGQALLSLESLDYTHQAF